MEGEEEEDLSGFEIEKAWDGLRVCPNIRIFFEEEARLNKPWRKTLIIKVLGRKIGFRVLELKFYQLWLEKVSLRL